MRTLLRELRSILEHEKAVYGEMLPLDADDAPTPSASVAEEDPEKTPATEMSSKDTSSPAIETDPPTADEETPDTVAEPSSDADDPAPVTTRSSDSGNSNEADPEGVDPERADPEHTDLERSTTGNADTEPSSAPSSAEASDATTGPDPTGDDASPPSGDVSSDDIPYDDAPSDDASSGDDAPGEAAAAASFDEADGEDDASRTADDETPSADGTAVGAGVPSGDARDRDAGHDDPNDDSPDGADQPSLFSQPDAGPSSNDGSEADARSEADADDEDDAGASSPSDDISPAPSDSSRDSSDSPDVMPNRDLFGNEVDPAEDPSLPPWERITSLIPDDAPYKDAETLEEVEAYLANNVLVPIDEDRENPVFGVGDPQADLVIIGEAPGRDEDKEGEPFVGRAGTLLDKILDAINFAREDVYITNILKSRPPRNRDPHAEEVEAHLPILYKQIALIRPKIMLCVGKVAGNTMLDRSSSLSSLRDTEHDFYGIPVIVTYHPAALLRNPQWKRPTWEDVKLLRTRYDQLTEDA